MDTSILQQVFTFDEEQWKDIPGYEGYYQVSTHGRVRSLDRTINARGKGDIFFKGRMSNLKINLSGYYAVSLSAKGKAAWIPVHRLVYMAFVEPVPDGHDVHHIDEDKINNHVSNLMAMSRSDHRFHHKSNGKSPVRGEGNRHNILSQFQVVEVVDLLDNSALSQREIADRYGVAEKTVNCINTGASWNWLTSRRSMPTLNRRSRNLKLANEDVASIRKEAQAGAQRNLLARTYGVSEGHIARIVAGYR